MHTILFPNRDSRFSEQLKRRNLLSLFMLFVMIITSYSVSKAQKMNCDTFTEMADPTKDVNSDWSPAQSGLNVTFASIDKRYPKSLLPNIEEKVAEGISGWKGERLSAQVLLWTTEEIPHISFEFSDFVSDQGKLPASIAKARFVRYVMTDEFRKGCGHRKPEDFASSLSADMLDNTDCMDLEANQVRPVWLSVEIPRTAKAGMYASTIKVKTKGGEIKELAIELEVVNQELPKSSEWSFHLDQWQHPSAVARIDSLELWSEAHFEAMKPTMQQLADAGQKVITATLNKDPWNVQTYDPYADMIIWKKNADGSWEYDYSVFDKWVEFMMDLGIKNAINAYSIVPWNNELHYKDSQTGEFLNVVAEPGTASFIEMWTPFLLDFVDHLNDKGWLEITNIAMDERDRKSMDATLKLLNEVAPELGVSYADNQKSYQRYPYSKDISVSKDHPVSHEDIIKRRENGLTTTFYVSCADAFPNQFTFSDPAESTYLAWYAMAADLDGLLRWAFNSWVEKPMHDSRFKTWPAGDTYIVYPNGRSSIRYERLLEGIQDYEKIVILKKQLLEKNETEKLNQLNQAIEKLKNVERTETWNANLNIAKDLLNKLSKEMSL